MSGESIPLLHSSTPQPLLPDQHHRYGNHDAALGVLRRLPHHLAGVVGHPLALGSLGGKDQPVVRRLPRVEDVLQVDEQACGAYPPFDEERRGFWEFKVLATGKVVTVRNPTEGRTR